MSCEKEWKCELRLQRVYVSFSARQRATVASLVSFRRRHKDAVDVLLVFFEENLHHYDVAGRKSLTGHFFLSFGWSW